MRTIYGNWLLDGLSERFGEGAVDDLVATYGCKRIVIPVTATGKLTKHLAPEVLDWLIETRGGEEITIPSAKAVTAKRRLPERNRVIATSKLSASALAARYQLSPRHIHKIRADYRAQHPSKDT